jgi:hypothetical protein
MQDFHPECTINLLLECRGNPSKIVWSCSLQTRNSVRLLSAEKFLGIYHRERAEWELLRFGLQQANLLKQEKVEICCPYFTEEEILNPRKLRDQELQYIRQNCVQLLDTFRLKKYSKMDEKEKQYLSNRVQAFFPSSKKDRK